MGSEKKAWIEKIMREKDLDVVAIQESYLKNDNAISFRGYADEMQNRTVGRGRGQIKGGGVLTLIRDGIPYTRVQGPLTANGDNTSDVLAIKLHLKHRDLTIVNVYVPPIQR